MLSKRGRWSIAIVGVVLGSACGASSVETAGSGDGGGGGGVDGASGDHDGGDSADAALDGDGAVIVFDASTADAVPPDEGPQVALTFTAIPANDPDLIGPGRGLEYWIYQWVVPNPLPSSPYNTLDRYDRFTWRTFQTTNANAYNWNVFDASVNEAIMAGQRFSFGIMPMCGACSPPETVSVGGAALSYPEFLHTAMQGEAVKDWIGDGEWVPNWNSPSYLTALRNLHMALAEHIADTSFMGVPYSKVVTSVDIRGYGSYGEWHGYPWLGSEPNGAAATEASLDAIISAHVDAFPNMQLQAIVNSLDPGGWSEMPAKIVHRIATSGNAHGRFGWRKDSWGATENYWFAFLDDSSVVYDGVDVGALIPEIWKFAPVTGEPYQCCTVNGGPELYWDLPRQVEKYHLSRLGNGNLEAGNSSATQNNMREAARLMGYRLLLTGGEMSTTITRGAAFSVALDWRNVGVAPTYEDWVVEFELRGAGGAPVWSGASTKILRLFLPAAAPARTQDNFVVPTSVPAGQYDLVVVIRDPLEYRDPLPLAITGRQADGSYLVRRVTVE